MTEPFADKVVLEHSGKLRVIPESTRKSDKLDTQVLAANRQLKSFVANAPLKENAYRELLTTIPGVGFVTVEVVLAEIADIDRFGSQKQVVAYAGISPCQRESAGKSKELHIEKTGSKQLRWIMTEAAWRLIQYSPMWKSIYLRKQMWL